MILVAEGFQAAAAAAAAAVTPHNHHQCQHGTKKRALSVSQRFRASSTDAPTRNSSTATSQASAEKVKLGASDVEVTKIGIGAWSWGDTFYWNNGSWNDRNVEDARAAFNASVDVGINFFDTAEVYGSQIMGVGGESEKLLGRFTLLDPHPEHCHRFSLLMRQNTHTKRACFLRSLARQSGKPKRLNTLTSFK